MIDTIFFDLYGTLIKLNSNSNPFLTLSKRQNQRPTKTLVNLSLTNLYEDLDAFRIGIGLEPQPDINNLEQSLKIDIESVEDFPEVQSTLSQLKAKKIRLGIISNLASPYKEPLFVQKWYPAIDHCIFSCDCGARKPSEKIFMLALAKFGCTAKNTLMVGDSYSSDIQGAKLAGIPAIHLDRSTDAECFNLTISNVSEILDML